MIKTAFWKGFAQKGTASLSKRVRRGYRSETIRSGGTDSLFAWLPVEAAKKVLGPKKVYKALGKLHDKALSADMIAGSIPDALMQKMPIGKKLFRQKDLVPYGKGIKKEVERTSLLAPAVKARDVAAPIIVGVALENGLKKLRKKDEPGTS